MDSLIITDQESSDERHRGEEHEHYANYGYVFRNIIIHIPY